VGLDTVAVEPETGDLLRVAAAVVHEVGEELPGFLGDHALEAEVVEAIELWECRDKVLDELGSAMEGVEAENERKIQEMG